MMKSISQILQSVPEQNREQKQDNSESKTQSPSWLASQRKTTLTNKYGNRDEFLQRFNPCYLLRMNDREKECYLGDYPTVGSLTAYGKNFPTVWMIPQLTSLSEYCGVKVKLTAGILEETACIMADMCRNLKITEVMLYFYRFKQNRYGKFYGSVDPLIITGELGTFLKERNDELYRLEQKRTQERNSCRHYDNWEEFCERHWKQQKNNTH